MTDLYGAIEFGGTKTICAVGNADGSITNHIIIPTSDIESTMSQVEDFFSSQAGIKGLGVATFGPVNLDKNSSEYGTIYNAPKPKWNNVSLKNLLSKITSVPIIFDLDVNCAAKGELDYGNARDLNNFIYLTIGTGVGGALVESGKVINRNLEMGHVRIPHEDLPNGFKGACEYHGDCFEGIASGYALHQCYGIKAESIDDNLIWDREATHIATAVVNLVLTFSPEKIILGGGVMEHPGLIGLVRKRVEEKIAGYVELGDIEKYILKSSGELNAVKGAINLVQKLDHSV